MGTRTETGSGTQIMPFSKLFNSEFMSKYTSFKSINYLFKACGIRIESIEDIKKIPDFDNFIRKYTKFSNWDEMQRTAAKEYFADEKHWK